MAMAAFQFKDALVKPTGFKNHIEVQRYNAPAPLTVRNHTEDLLVYSQIFDNSQYEVQFEEAPRVIIDAGAHIGLTSVYFAQRFPDARIISLEPDPGNFELLKLNTAHYEQITPLNVALWDSSGTISLKDFGLGNWGFQVSDESAGARAQVVAITVPDLITRYNLDQIDLFKVDIEGAEREVFRVAETWINRVRSLIVELHESHSPGSNRAFYTATQGFDQEWFRVENVYVTRGNYMRPSEGQGIIPQQF